MFQIMKTNLDLENLTLILCTNSSILVKSSSCWIPILEIGFLSQNQYVLFNSLNTQILIKESSESSKSWISKGFVKENVKIVILGSIYCKKHMIFTMRYCVLPLIDSESFGLGPLLTQSAFSSPCFRCTCSRQPDRAFWWFQCFRLRKQGAMEYCLLRQWRSNLTDLSNPIKRWLFCN